MKSDSAEKPESNAGGAAKIFAAVSAVAVSFAMYATAFEPFGVAEFAYVFAVPAIIACRFLCGKSEKTPEDKSALLKSLKAAGLDTPAARKKYAIPSDAQDDANAPFVPRNGKKIWLVSSFAFCVCAWIVILAWLRHVYPPAGYFAALALPLVVGGGFVFPWFAYLPRLLPSLTESVFVRLVKLAGLAGLWVVLEWLRSWVFTGFPWSLLAHSQWLRPAAIQTAAFGGVWIVSFTLIFFNLALAEYVWRLYQSYRWKIATNFEKRPPFSKISPEFYAALLMSLASVWIYASNLPRRENERTAFTAGMMQTDFAGILKWNDSLARENFDVVNRLSRGLANDGVDVELWPEAATPPQYPLVGSPQIKAWLEGISRETKIPIITGNMAYDFDAKTAQNGAFYISPESGLSPKYYAKRRLVPFGEYVPSWCKWVGKVVPSGEMTAGENPVLLDVEIAGRKYKIGTMICYEDIFPNLGLEHARNGADILFVCTNDSWYGREGGAWQHAAHSAFQAVANRLPLMRSSNNGLSAVFDQYGRMRPSFTLKNPDGSAWNAATPAPARGLKISTENGLRLDADTLAPRRPSPLVDENGSIYFRGAGSSDVVFYKNFDGEKSFYTRHGDWFVALSCLLFAAACGVKMSESRRVQKKA